MDGGCCNAVAARLVCGRLDHSFCQALEADALASSRAHVMVEWTMGGRLMADLARESARSLPRMPQWLGVQTTSMSRDMPFWM